MQRLTWTLRMVVVLVAGWLTGCAAAGGAYTLDQELLDKALAVGDEATANDIYLRRIKRAVPLALDSKYPGTIYNVSISSKEAGEFSIHIYADETLADGGRGFKQKLLESFTGTVLWEFKQVGMLEVGEVKLKSVMVTVWAGRDIQYGRKVGTYRWPDNASLIR